VRGPGAGGKRRAELSGSSTRMSESGSEDLFFPPKGEGRGRLRGRGGLRGCQGLRGKGEGGGRGALNGEGL